jgi:transcriptional regulator of acetoin/glycerol metabolism
MNQLPATPFFSTRADRVELARRRYFEEGKIPTGVVSDAIFQSWARCQRLHNVPTRPVVFEPVTVSRTQLALQKNRHLRDAWNEELPELETLLSATSCAAMLTDPTGVLIGATCAGRAHELLMPIATRLGVNLSEEAVGTTAPGVVSRTGQPVTVHGGEHFFEQVKAMNCAAAPIRDVDGQLVGVLDISSEGIPFSFDAAAVVSLYASAIESRLLMAQSAQHQHLVLRFQISATLLDSPVAALIGIASDGRLAWCNGTAARLLGLTEGPGSIAIASLSAEFTLGASLARLASLPDHGAAPLHLPNGLAVWARATMHAADGYRNLFKGHSTSDIAHSLSPEPSRASGGRDTDVAHPPPVVSAEVTAENATLRELDLDLIERTLKERNGNVSEVARQLGVSRGLIYRRLRAKAASR